MYQRVRIKWKHGLESGVAFDIFGYPEYHAEHDVDGSVFWYEEGNGSCDCCRAGIIGVGQSPCGDSIEFTDIKFLPGLWATRDEASDSAVAGEGKYKGWPQR